MRRVAEYFSLVRTPAQLLSKGFSLTSLVFHGSRADSHVALWASNIRCTAVTFFPMKIS